MSISTYCGSFSQRRFREHIAGCGVCWEDAQERSDLEFDPRFVARPNTVTNEELADEVGELVGCNVLGRLEAIQEDLKTRQYKDAAGELTNLIDFFKVEEGA